jgi:protein-S-isoprenylcysteine O-methyltransferase Ste14
MNSAHPIATDLKDLSRYQRRRRLYIFLAILVMGALLLVSQSVWSQSLLSLSIRAIGILLISAGILGRIWCTFYIGGRKSNEVVTDGPYSIMRNPLYFFSSIASVGVGAQTGSIILALLVGTLCVIAFLIVIRREEAFLGGTFGAAYSQYCARVPRFFPNFSLFRDPETIAVSTTRVYQTLLDGLVFFIAVPLLALVEYAQIIGWLPVFLRLY